MLVASIAESVRTLSWTLVLLLLTTYILGIYLTQLVTDHRAHVYGPIDDDLLRYYGSLDKAMITLYQATSNGLDWSHAMEPLVSHCSPWIKVVYIFYVAFTLFALMNVVTGVFCTSAIQSGADEQTEVLEQQMQDFFKAADEDCNGQVTEVEFASHLQNEQMLAYLKAIDVQPEEAWRLYEVLDKNEEGALDSATLVRGCMQLRGPAKAIELAAFVHEHRQDIDALEAQISILVEHTSRSPRFRNPRRSRTTRDPVKRSKVVSL